MYEGNLIKLHLALSLRNFFCFIWFTSHHLFTLLHTYLLAVIVSVVLHKVVKYELTVTLWDGLFSRTQGVTVLVCVFITESNELGCLVGIQPCCPDSNMGKNLSSLLKYGHILSIQFPIRCCIATEWDEKCVNRLMTYTADTLFQKIQQTCFLFYSFKIHMHGNSIKRNCQTSLQYEDGLFCVLPGLL